MTVTINIKDHNWILSVIPYTCTCIHMNKLKKFTDKNMIIKNFLQHNDINRWGFLLWFEKNLLSIFGLMKSAKNPKFWPSSATPSHYLQLEMISKITWNLHPCSSKYCEKKNIYIYKNYNAVLTYPMV